jgi:hypothetical protein
MVIELTGKKILLDRFGDTARLTGKQQDEQILRHQLLLFRGYWFDDLQAGTDWFRVVGKGVSVNIVKAEIKRALLATGVVDEVLIISLGTPNKDRGVVLTFVVRTLNGIISFSEEL